MNTPLKHVLLIDDDLLTNSLNQIQIVSAGFAENVSIESDGRRVLDELTNIKRYQPPQLDLIFLDILMPEFSGWDFLNHYQLLPEENRVDIVVLTSSTNPADIDYANDFQSVVSVLAKPLDRLKLQELAEVLSQTKKLMQ